MAPTLSVFVLHIATTLLLWCVYVSARLVNPHRFHNLIFHPKEMMTKHRIGRDDDCQSDDWEHMTFAGRIANGDSDAIIQGTVLRLINDNNPFRPYQGRGRYTAEVLVDCLYRGWNYGAVVNISGFGETPDCVHTHVALGKSYIFLIQTDWFGMAVDEVNDQVGVMETDQDLINYISSFHRCRGPYETTTPPGSSYESSDSASEDRYSQYESIEIIYPISSSFSSSYSSSYTVEYSDHSQSESYYPFSYYDYDKDGKLDFFKWKNRATRIHSDHILPVIIALSSTVLHQSIV